MKRFFAVLVAAFALTACDVEFAAITELEGLATGLVEATQVGQVGCESRAILVGETTRCIALNLEGSRISFEGNAVALWSSSAPLIASVSIDGYVSGQSAGQAWIIARGTYNSADSAQFTVSSP